MQKTRIAVIGCGAVSERSHLPTLNALLSTAPAFEISALVDTDESRLARLAAHYDVATTSTDFSNILDEFDAAIVAVPHHLHAPVGAALLRAGKHVLMEKPLALTSVDCHELIALGEQNERVLAVGLVRRYMHAYEFLYGLIKSSALGSVTGFDIEEGAIYGWPVASDFFFRKEFSGGGVLVDTGAHVLDAALWWLGQLEPISYADDAAGGIEADCEMLLEAASGVRGEVKLSRIRTLRNTTVVEFERGQAEIGMFTNTIKLTLKDRTVLNGWSSDQSQSDATQTTLDLFTKQLSAWLAAIHKTQDDVADAPQIIAGKDAVRSIELIEKCYAGKTSLLHPWQAA